MCTKGEETTGPLGLPALITHPRPQAGTMVTVEALACSSSPIYRVPFVECTRCQTDMFKGTLGSNPLNWGRRADILHLFK